MTDEQYVREVAYAITHAQSRGRFTREDWNRWVEQGDQYIPIAVAKARLFLAALNEPTVPRCETSPSGVACHGVDETGY